VEILGDIWHNGIVQPMINSLVLLYVVLFKNFGLAIIAFTLVIRILLIPLTIRQSRQLRAMTSLQPKLKEIQQKYAKDRQRLSQETMRTYKEHGVNPIGCLGPLVIQFPIWIGLFTALRAMLPESPESLVELSNNFYAWLPWVNASIPLDTRFLWMNLGEPDATPVMPVLVGVSMWMMQKMTMMPAADPRQESTNRMMLWMMPLMFGFFTTQFQAGLAVYWVVSNVIGITIQGFITGWGPLLSITSIRMPWSKGASSAPSTMAPVPALVASAKETPDDDAEERDRDHSEDTGRSNRNRPKGARRRSRGSRNRRR
jgi:YidC/Oxa1 family membrane protein insertase